MQTPNMNTLTMRTTTVTGAWPPKNSERPLLQAAREKRRLVPHSWQRLAWMPTKRRRRDRVAGVFRRSRRTCRRRFASSARGAFANGREGPTVLLAGFRTHSYNTGTRRAIRRRGPMDKFEEFGRKLDDEITRLRKYLDEEVAR